MTVPPIRRTFAQLESALPGGFAAARLAGVTVRPREHVLELAFEFPAQGPAPARVALVSVREVAWLEFEPRDPKAGGKHASMRVTSDALDADALAALGLPPVPEGAFAHRLHAQGTDGAMCFAAGSATLEWAAAPDPGTA